MPTLTKARTAQLCDEIRELRLKAAATHGGEHSLAATYTREIGMEHLLWRVVRELAGGEAGAAVTEALSYSPTTGDIEAHRAANAARQQAYLQRAQAATAQVPA